MALVSVFVTSLVLFAGCKTTEPAPRADPPPIERETACFDSEDSLIGFVTMDVDEATASQTRWVRLTYDGASLREELLSLHRAGIRAVVVVGPSATGMSPPGRTGSDEDWESYRDAFLGSLETLVTDLGPEADAYEIWPRANDGASHAPPAHFGAMLVASAELVRATSNAALITGAIGVGGGCELSVCEDEIQGVEYLRAALQTVGAVTSFDSFGVDLSVTTAPADRAAYQIAPESAEQLVGEVLSAWEPMRRSATRHAAAKLMVVIGGPVVADDEASARLTQRALFAHSLPTLAAQRFRIDHVFVDPQIGAGSGHINVPLSELGIELAPYDDRPSCSGAGLGSGDPDDELCAPAGACVVSERCRARVGACYEGEICNPDGWWSPDVSCGGEGRSRAERMCSDEGLCWIAPRCRAAVGVCVDGRRCEADGVFHLNPECEGACETGGTCVLAGSRCPVVPDTCDDMGNVCQLDGSWTPAVRCGGTVCDPRGVCPRDGACDALATECDDAGNECDRDGRWLPTFECGGCEAEPVCEEHGTCGYALGGCDEDGNECQAGGGMIPTIACGGIDSTIILIRASGTSFEGEFANLQLRVAGEIIQTWETTAEMADYAIELEGIIDPTDVEVRFTNDRATPTGVMPREDRNLRVDYVEIGGTRFQSESPRTYSVGVFAPGDMPVCGPGFKESELLSCNGYFQYAM